MFNYKILLELKAVVLHKQFVHTDKLRMIYIIGNMYMYLS
jgi:hypothetical protein